MKALTIALLATAVAAIPQGEPKNPCAPKSGRGSTPVNPLAGGSGANKPATSPNQIANEVMEGACKDIIFIMARASTEPGNMGGTMGPIVCKGLKENYPDKVACQGVGGAYSAGILDNVQPKGTTAAAISEATKMFTQASTKCPNALLTFGGYSQGSAVMHNTVSALSEAMKSKIVAGVLFGDTRNKQDGYKIANFPKEKVMIFCDSTDGVCEGKLSVTQGHMVYACNGDGPKGISFLKGKIDAALGKKGARFVD
ncbi:cutinase-domain-containing protein [Tothia fuscella]|uniref:Cutinase n=1 Tax=Tothia fuscella TaxID=1048955 RepID=A0A9P4TXK9_9PEZI|nr:cutinase-domain-containing protein [Tothia fuscella]